MSPSPSTGTREIPGASARELSDSYEIFKFAPVTARRFTQEQLFGWLAPFERSGLFTRESLGHSGEGRAIPLLTLGEGETKVLLWSQMHGDESTATMALLDIFNYFSLRRDDPLPSAILEKLTLLVIPMLNPDGAQRYQRRTAQGIDMNRDALALQTPEAQILKSVQAAHHPPFGFNLHDQDPRYTVGNSTNVSAIALLAPAYDIPRSDNDVRRAAKQVAAVFAAAVGACVPGHVSKYDDTFEPRAFGDNVQRWGTSTVLVESGGWPGDREKMFIRRLNYVGLLASLASIASGAHRTTTTTAYDELPFGTKFLFDVVLRNARLQVSEGVEPVRVDVGINFDPVPDGSPHRVTLKGTVMDIGDLHTYGAFNNVDMNGELLASREIQLEKEIRNEYFTTLLAHRGVNFR